MLPKDAAERLGIAKPTLRKWAAEFGPWLSAEAGQPEVGHDRRYSESDIALLQRIKSLLAERYSYEQIREQLGDAQKRAEDVSAPERSATAHGEQVVIIGEQPEVETLRALLDAHQTALAGLQGTIEAQQHLIDAQRAQVESLTAGINAAQQETADTRADLVGQLEATRARLAKVPRWLRALFGAIEE